MNTLETTPEIAHIEDKGLRELSKRLICECLKDAMNYSKKRIASTDFLNDGGKASKAKNKNPEARKNKRLALVKERVENFIEDPLFKGICISYGLRPEACELQIKEVMTGHHHAKIEKLLKQVRAYKPGKGS